MGAKKIKVEKKRADRTVEIVSAYDRFKIWTEEHYVAVSVAVVVVLLIPLVVWGVGTYKESQQRIALEAYASVVAQWPEKDVSDPKVWDGIIAGLKKCIEEHGGSKAALDAQLDLARAQYQAGHYDEAVKWAEKVLGQAQSVDEIKQMARYQMAQAYEMLGKPDEALSQWEAVQKTGFPGMEREVNWHLAVLYAKKAQYAKAVTHYEAALAEAGTYPATPLLQEELALVKLKTDSAGEMNKQSPPKPQNAG